MTAETVRPVPGPGQLISLLAALELAAAVMPICQCIATPITAVAAAHITRECGVQAIPNMQLLQQHNTYVLTCGCSDACLGSLPDVTFELGGRSYDLSPANYIIQVCRVSHKHCGWSWGGLQLADPA